MQGIIRRRRERCSPTRCPPLAAHEIADSCGDKAWASLSRLRKRYRYVGSGPAWIQHAPPPDQTQTRIGPEPDRSQTSTRTASDRNYAGTQTRTQTGSQTGTRRGTQTGTQTGSQTGTASVREPVREPVRGAVRDAVGEPEGQIAPGKRHADATGRPARPEYE